MRRIASRGVETDFRGDDTRWVAVPLPRDGVARDAADGESDGLFHAAAAQQQAGDLVDVGALFDQRHLAIGLGEAVSVIGGREDEGDVATLELVSQRKYHLALKLPV